MSTAEAVMTWQPIDTAIPATGQAVLLWGRLWRQPFVGIVLPDAMGSNCYLDGRDGVGMHAQAHYWMPIPDPPK